jgi:threonine dehydratase
MATMPKEAFPEELFVPVQESCSGSCFCMQYNEGERNDFYAFAYSGTKAGAGKDVWGFIDIVLYGDTFDEAKDAAMRFCNENDGVFIHPFDDPAIIEGQATTALEILEQADEPIDYLFVPMEEEDWPQAYVPYLKNCLPKPKLLE